MKKISHIFAAIVIACWQARAADELSLVQQADALWKSENYNQILQLATVAAAKPSPAPEVFVVLFGYYSLIKADRAKALQALSDLLSHLPPGNSTASSAITEFKSKFEGLPIEGFHQPTVGELKAFHDLFPEYLPVRALIVLLPK